MNQACSISPHTWFLCSISPLTWFLCYLNFLCLCLFLFRKCDTCSISPQTWFLCYLCLCLFHKCEPGLFHLTAHLVPLLFEFLMLVLVLISQVNQACSISPHTWFLCYLNFLCLCLFLFHKCEPGSISPHTWFTLGSFVI